MIEIVRRFGFYEYIVDFTLAEGYVLQIEFGIHLIFGCCKLYIPKDHTDPNACIPTYKLQFHPDIQHICLIPNATLRQCFQVRG